MGRGEAPGHAAVGIPGGGGYGLHPGRDAQVPVCGGREGCDRRDQV